jgi:hypothetical protein
MGKSATRLCTLTVWAALAAVSIATPANSAASGNTETLKGKRKLQNGPNISEPRPANPSWPPPMYDDFDRKNAGGGGGM